MKIALGMKPIDGPWGGGNQFIKNLSNYLSKQSFKITYSLEDNDIDIILIIDPRKKNYQDNISIEEAREYKKKRKNTKIILRVNECDERKNTNHINEIFIKSASDSDMIIFVSDWLKSLYINHGMKNENIDVIRSSADRNIFFPNNEKIYKKDILQIVTHHWSSNKNKGFDLYKSLDKYLGIPEIKRNFTFHYIGNKPKLFFFRNSQYTKPTYGKNLGDLLRNSDIYLTASINEPAGMHFIEGISSGLPVLYVKSGGTTEYCSEIGIDFNENNLIEKLFEMKNNFKELKKKCLENQHSFSLMNETYSKLFIKVMS
jgi:hypothetical protein